MDATILEAIPGVNPSGENLRYELIYGEIRKRVRIARGDVLSDSNNLDFRRRPDEWGIVISACIHVLKRRSKDLMIAAWLAEAWLARDGLSGLQKGLDVLRGLLETFWETLYPEIEDGDVEARIQIFEWVDTHLAEAVQMAHTARGDTKKTEISAMELSNAELVYAELPGLIDCRDSLVELEDACSAKVGKRGIFPNLRSAIFGAMRETLQSLASVMEGRSPMAANILRGGFRDWITKDDLEKLLDRSLWEPVACADDERLHAHDPVASAPPPVSVRPSAPPPPSAPAPMEPAKPEPPRIRKLSDGKASRRSVKSMPPSASAPDMPAQVVNREVQRVDFTLTAPATVASEVPFELFVWAHAPEERAKVLARAREELNVRELLARSKGPYNVAGGTILSVRLVIPGAAIDEAEDTMMWEGESTCVSFVVTLPHESRETKWAGSAQIYANGVRVARISFVLSTAGMAEVSGVRYKKAFASYASADRDAVLGRIQGIHKVAPEMEIFLDVASLRSGQNWEQELWRVIPSRDIFYLFWSSHARQSEWVEKEWRCALRERGIEFIDPIPLESPQESPPPPELSSLHFNDWELAFRRGKPLP